MRSLRNSVYALVAVGSLAMAAYQPSEEGVVSAGQAVGNVFAQLSAAFQPADDATPR